jgi:flavin-binding protein dodecin
VRVAVIKTIDLVGVSTESWRDAAQAALAEASKTLRGIEGMEVLETSAVVDGDKIKEYHTHVRIRFRLER